MGFMRNLSAKSPAHMYSIFSLQMNEMNSKKNNASKSYEAACIVSQ